MKRFELIYKKEWFLLVVLGLIFMFTIIAGKSHSSPSAVSVREAHAITAHR